MASDRVVVSADLRSEAVQDRAYRALRRRFPTLLLLGYTKGQLSELVIQVRGQPKALLVVEPEQGEPK